MSIKMSVETEIKFRMPERHLGASSRLAVPGCKIGQRSESDLLSTYFDTPKSSICTSSSVNFPYGESSLR